MIDRFRDMQIEKKEEERKKKEDERRRIDEERERNFFSLLSLARIRLEDVEFICIYYR